MCVWEERSAAMLAGGGGERERNRSERGKEMQKDREREGSKAFTGTKHSVSIS